MTYRISLRSSSIWEPRHPLLKVFDSLLVSFTSLRTMKVCLIQNQTTFGYVIKMVKKGIRRHHKFRGTRDAKVGRIVPKNETSFSCFHLDSNLTPKHRILLQTKLRCGNDPSAGSPTETLLRLHLPLNDEV